MTTISNEDNAMRFGPDLVRKLDSVVTECKMRPAVVIICANKLAGKIMKAGCVAVGLVALLLTCAVAAQEHNVGLYWCDESGTCSLIASEYDPYESDQPSAGDEYSWTVQIDSDGGGGGDIEIQSSPPESKDHHDEFTVEQFADHLGDETLSDSAMPLPRVIVRGDAPRRQFVRVRLGVMFIDALGNFFRRLFGRQPTNSEIDYADDPVEGPMTCGEDLGVRSNSARRVAIAANDGVAPASGSIVIAHMVDGNSDTWITSRSALSVTFGLVTSTCGG